MEKKGGIAMPITYRMNHNNINVQDLERSLAFYREALGLEEVRRVAPEDGSFIIAFLGDGVSGHSLELTWLRDHPQPYDLGENEIHLGFVTNDYDAAFIKHTQMGCVCFVNEAMGIYFIEDPDGYWMEVVTERG